MFHDNADSLIEFRGYRYPTSPPAYINDAELLASVGSRQTGECGYITGATNATPIVVTTAAAHGLTDGAIVLLYGVQGNEAANGTFVVRSPTSTTFALETLAEADAVGSGDFSPGTDARDRGEWALAIPGAYGLELEYQTGTDGTYAVTVPGTTHLRHGRIYTLLIYPATDSTTDTYVTTVPCQYKR